VKFDIDLVSADDLRKMIKNTQSPLPPFQKGAVGDDAHGVPSDVMSDVTKISEYEEKLRQMYNFEYKKDFLSKVPAKISVSSLRPGLLTDDEYTAQALKDLDMAPLPRFLEETAENIPALTGTATHLFMQFADFEYAEVFGANNEAENLLSKGFITEAQYSRIIFYPIDKFFSSDLYEKIKSAKRVYREMPFTLKVSVSEFMDNENITQTPLPPFQKGAENDEYILVQGAIDLFFEDKKGKIYVVDFKTDQVHRPDGEKILINRHKRQINYYCKAVSEILNKPVSGAYIYSFALNEAVPVV